MKIIPIPHIKRFIQDESGVYAVMGGLLALPIVALMFVSLESAGIIQDKARLSDSLEQAVLSLSAENNSGRKKNDYRLSDTDAENGHFHPESKIGKRDLEIAESFVMTYLPQTAASKMSLTPICETKEKTNSKGHTSSAETTCTVSGTIQHKSWFPLKVGNTEVIPAEVKVASASKAFKKNIVSIPIDLMVVADLSGSMDFNLAGQQTYAYNKNESKISILKEVLNELAMNSLFSQESNDKNRIAVSPFALGAEYSATECTLPFVFNDNPRTISYTDRFGKKTTRNTQDIIKEYLTTPGSSNSKLSRAVFTQSLATQIDVTKTLSSIGSPDKVGLKFLKNAYCLGEKNRNHHKWFTQGEQGEFSTFVNQLEAVGSTFAGSGLLAAADKMLKEKGRSKELGEETKRVLLVLSDGNDELRAEDSGVPFKNYSRLTEDLILGYQEETLASSTEQTFYDSNPYSRIGSYSGKSDIILNDGRKQLSDKFQMCNIIRDKLNELNDDKNTSIVFVEFGYQSKSADAWKKCVGNENYHSATNRETLLNSFKQAIGHTDDVGHSIN
ncbi:TadE/TadG family type IV pilus assembly protein [Actinobacillus equuli]|uniref:Tight adherence protein G n=1 Tax=Actinobacillus equuli TaxID=718 RepID=A0AAX3FH02_ACTEU|nr:TadE/TadG family type IV pilus assembly protein [Actinobacillus equuli]AIZ79029.1 tight adherence protein G [Actinobacillus equuli subsp. equuli]WGE45275.1 pilus assembly protein [Actinobacillus equuli subsp. equuli]VEE89124.1 tight adherence protein G [Actinobacillus equuli]